MTAPTETPQREQLIESLWRDARKESEEILRKAGEEAERLRAEARAKAEAAIQEGREKARGKVAPEAARIVNRSRRETQREVLLAHGEVLKEVFSEAASALEGLPPREAAASVIPLLTEAVGDVPPGTSIRVVCPPSQVEACRKALVSSGLSGEVAGDGALPVGVRVELDGGSEVRENTFPARLANLREDPPLALLATLFGREG